MNRSRKLFRVCFVGVSSTFFFLGLIGIYITFSEGLAPWGINYYAVWGVAIVNFIFWIGNAHSGTLISAILHLMRIKWRRPMHRLAETLTLISLIIAITFPLLHLGRPWFFYWLFPFPNEMSLQPNFKSALLWDVFAILTYSILSFLFWLMGFIPELKQTHKPTIISKRLINNLGVYSAENWKEYQWTYHILAGILTFVVISVHSIVSFDFATAILPFWHSTFLPLHFVFGAIYSGTALVLLSIWLYNNLNKYGITVPSNSTENLSKLLLAFSFIMLYFYLVELFFSFYSLNHFELSILTIRFDNELFWITLAVFVFNIIFPQLLWIKKIRTTSFFLFLIPTLVLIGMWMERYVIVLASLKMDFTSDVSYSYIPTLTDIALTLGSFGFYNLLFFILAELIQLVPKESPTNE